MQKKILITTRNYKFATIVFIDLTLRIDKKAKEKKEKTNWLDDLKDTSNKKKK